MYRKFGKRLVDLVLSGIALIPLSVVYLILAIATPALQAAAGHNGL